MMKTEIRNILLATALLCAAACGDDGDDGGDSTPDASTAQSDGGSMPDGATGPDGAGQGSEVLLPLMTGLSWTYQVDAVGGGAACAPGVHTEQVIGPVQVDGRDAFEVSSWCAPVGTSTLFADGDKVESRYMNGWITVLDTPVEEGHTWTSTGPINYTWRDAGSVTVPAGTFDDCWTREQNVTYTAYTTFCRGVGAVRDYSEDLLGNGWDAQLTQRSM